MFFILASTLGILTIPSHALGLLALLGALLLMTRFRIAGRRILIFCLVVFVACGVAPVGGLLLYIVESRLPEWTDKGSPPPDGIIVLGGAGAERLAAVPALARRFPNARVVFTGGNASLFGGPSEASYAVPLLESFGIPRERIVAEDRSRNTRENAAFAAELLKPTPAQRWILVTSAVHMPRSVGAFRKAGFSVEAYPVDWKSDRRGPSWRWLVPSLSLPGSWMNIDAAAKEMIGLAADWLAGYTSDLFPGPVNPGAAGPDGKRP
jgi:uncharacterized SAM-binding protein YcdF (DUF218 family)